MMLVTFYAKERAFLFPTRISIIDEQRFKEWCQVVEQHVLYYTVTEL